MCESFSLMILAFYKNGDSADLLNSFETLWLKISYFSPSYLKPTSCLLTQATWRSAGLHCTSDKRCTGLCSDAPKRSAPLHQGAAVWEDVHGPRWSRVGGHLLQKGHYWWEVGPAGSGVLTVLLHPLSLCMGGGIGEVYLMKGFE